MILMRFLSIAMDTSQKTTDTMMSFWSATGTERHATGGVARAAVGGEEGNDDTAEMVRELRERLQAYETMHEEDQEKIRLLRDRLRGSVASFFDPVIAEEEEDEDDDQVDD